MSHNPDTRQGITAPNTNTAVERASTQCRKKAENLDESNTLVGKANSPETTYQFHIVKELRQTQLQTLHFTGNSINQYVKNVITTLQRT
jgi:hypothetical protein